QHEPARLHVQMIAARVTHPGSPRNGITPDLPARRAGHERERVHCRKQMLENSRRRSLRILRADELRIRLARRPRNACRTKRNELPAVNRVQAEQPEKPADLRQVLGPVDPHELLCDRQHLRGKSRLSWNHCGITFSLTALAEFCTPPPAAAAQNGTVKPAHREPFHGTNRNPRKTEPAGRQGLPARRLEREAPRSETNPPCDQSQQAHLQALSLRTRAPP